MSQVIAQLKLKVNNIVNLNTYIVRIHGARSREWYVFVIR